MMVMIMMMRNVVVMRGLVVDISMETAIQQYYFINSIFENTTYIKLRHYDIIFETVGSDSWRNT